jgi:hypothetical protein
LQLRQEVIKRLLVQRKVVVLHISVKLTIRNYSKSFRIVLNMDSSSVCFFPGSSGVYSAGRVVNTQPSIVAYQHAYLVGAIAGRSLRARAKAREQLTHSACVTGSIISYFH